MDGWKYLGADGIERRLLDDVTARLDRIQDAREQRIADRVLTVLVGDA